MDNWTYATYRLNINLSWLKSPGSIQMEIYICHHVMQSKREMYSADKKFGALWWRNDKLTINSEHGTFMNL